jgi:hypothetical protein
MGFQKIMGFLSCVVFCSFFPTFGLFFSPLVDICRFLVKDRLFFLQYKNYNVS